MVKRRASFQQLEGGYLFPEIEKRKEALLKKNPEAQLISLGIGDTPLPLTLPIAKALEEAGRLMGTSAGYKGYGPSKGDLALRKKIAEVIYRGIVDPDDIFVTDGAKCDIARLQLLFSDKTSIAIQDPAYPVYADTTIMTEKRLTLLPCTPENNFFPQSSDIPDHVDVLILCSPNNPTGATATFEQLQELVNWAKKSGKIIIYDAAYAAFIQGHDHPRSIFEIAGADSVALEMNSFSKMAGFTGVRLSWTVLSDKVRYSDGTSMKKDWTRTLNTCFNGASRLSQMGAIAALDTYPLLQENLNIYLKNAQVIKRCVEELGMKAYGGEHIPYVWAEVAPLGSWEAFDRILEQSHVVTTPGAGFGKAGEGFLRLSAFARPEDIRLACNRLEKRGRARSPA